MYLDQAVTESSSGASGTGTVYHGNVSSRIYHDPGCRYYNCNNCTREFRSKEEAHQAGYRECKICSLFL